MIVVYLSICVVIFLMYFTFFALNMLIPGNSNQRSSNWTAAADPLGRQFMLIRIYLDNRHKYDDNTSAESRVLITEIVSCGTKEGARFFCVSYTIRRKNVLQRRSVRAVAFGITVQ